MGNTEAMKTWMGFDVGRDEGTKIMRTHEINRPIEKPAINPWNTIRRLESERDAARAKLHYAKSPHLIVCNAYTGPIGCPGCICQVVNKNDLADLRAREENLAKVLDPIVELMAKGNLYDDYDNACKLLGLARAALDSRNK